MNCRGKFLLSPVNMWLLAYMLISAAEKAPNWIFIDGNLGHCCRRSRLDVSRRSARLWISSKLLNRLRSVLLLVTCLKKTHHVEETALQHGLLARSQNPIPITKVDFKLRVEPKQLRNSNDLNTLQIMNPNTYLYSRKLHHHSNMRCLYFFISYQLEEQLGYWTFCVRISPQNAEESFDLLNLQEYKQSELHPVCSRNSLLPEISFAGLHFRW